MLGEPDLSAIRSEIEKSRRDLLDLGLRNTLLNYRPLKSRGLELVDEVPREVFRILVADGRPMSFLASEAAAELPPTVDDEGARSLAQPEDEAPGVAERHVDSKLQTAYSPQSLQSRLLQTHYAARTSIEEQGLNVLYLALGMLEWREASGSIETRRAPLILVPVELFRADVQSRFRVRYLGDDIRTNLSLQAKLKHDFAVELPELPDEDIDVDGYFARVAEVVSRLPGWRVDDTAVAIGFFSFNKLLMFEDLDVTRWPEEARPERHGVLQSLLVDLGDGVEEADDPPAALDERVRPGEHFQVVDADSSQAVAILEAMGGRDLVIQGPPGTGKSQTITNLIAELIGTGKRVLFVAEKMAALDVVKRRLDEIGLGDACLELHSHRVHKKAVLDELNRTLRLKTPKTFDGAESARGLDASRAKLNAYCRAVNEPLGATGVSPYLAYGQLLRLEGAVGGDSGLAGLAPELAQLRGLAWTEWPREETHRKLESVRELQSLIQRIGAPEAHPFWRSAKKLYLPTVDWPALVAATGEAVAATDELMVAAERLAAPLGVPAPTSAEHARLLLDTGRTVVEAPDLDGIDLVSSSWLALRATVTSVIDAGARATALRAEGASRLIPEAWDQDVLQARQAIAVYGTKWWRLLASEYRAARRRLAGLCASAPPATPAAYLELADLLLEYRRAASTVAEQSAPLAALFGTRWQGLRSDWGALRKIAEYLLATHEAIGAARVRSEVLGFLARRERPSLTSHVESLERARERFAAAWRELVEAAALDEGRFEGGLETFALTGLRSAAAAMAADVDRVQEMVTYNHLVERLRAQGLGPVEALAARWQGAAAHLHDLVEVAWYSAILEKSQRERPELAAFEGATHDHHVQLFRDHDRLVLRHNRARLAMAHWQRVKPLTQGSTGQVGVLLREFEKKRRHKPVRQLIDEAGRAIQVVKPVFMMSPLSIAAYVPPGSIEFDVVIFDEASQVRPVDAFGAILRAKQAIVVGDSKQLPPTSFFERIADGEETPEEEVSLTGDLESILGLFCARGKRQKMLRWHYRSRHESLIAVSNREFYDNELVLFPSPDRQRRSLGLILRHLPETAYARGEGRAQNKEEAWHVARAVLRHAKNDPHSSLGVAAFSQAQMQAILDQLEYLRRQDPSCEPFFASHPEEPFFVKNLENVQGDERDVIFISVGYGRDKHGYVAMSFGPLNQDGGERRLNVLITRARQRCEVFTNLTADDIDLQRTKARGVVALKTFLQYAKTGDLEVPLSTDREPESDFEVAVAHAIRGHGFEVHQQVGSGGFFVDLAIPHPELKGRYALGIECDGAPYHSASWARDRDRLRQEVLERLGWTIHRIWSTDWYRHPQRELKRVVEAAQRAIAHAAVLRRVEGRPPSPEPVLTVERIDEELHEHRQASDIEPYEMAAILLVAPEGLHAAPVEMLATKVAEVVRQESPVHFDEVASRLAAAAGTKVGSRVRRRIEEAEAMARGRGWVQRRGEFLWVPGAAEAKPRDRSALPVASRKIELIAPEELKAAALKIVETSHGIATDELVAEVCRVVGFARVTEGMRGRVEEVVRALFEGGGLALQGGQAVLGQVN